MAARSSATWLDGFGEWSWPGLTPAAAVAEAGPAAWVPSLPRRVEAPLSRAPVARARPLPRPLRLARLVMLAVVAGGTFMLGSGVAHTVRPTAPALSLPLELAPGTAFAPPGVVRAVAVRAAAEPVGVLAPQAVPTVISTDASGASIARVTFSSRTLGWRDSFLVYLPAGYGASSTRRYPVLYLLHGDKEPAASFLTIGLRSTLDQLIASHTIRPMIAVMLQANGLPNNWRNVGGRGPRYGDYIAEVQRLTDRVLATIPSRASRGIAGYSMGGFGAMTVALTQLRTYSLVESWEGFFANLSGTLAADRPLLRRMPLHAFVYGASSDTVAGYAEDLPWAAAMRAAGADATGAVYAGIHSFTPLEQHLAAMLTYAGRALRS